MRKKWRDMSVRRAFISSVCITILLALFLSLGTIAAGLAFQNWLLPDREQLYLNVEITYSNQTEQSFVISMQPGETLLHLSGSNNWTLIEMAREDIPELRSMLDSSELEDREIEDVQVSLDRIETSYSTLTPRRKLAYMGTSAAMVVLPMFYAFLGIILCAMTFYKKKLVPPITVLSEATENIRANDLDFTVSYDSKDELGQLCTSFETMRVALEKNNQKLWSMLEDRKALQASVAHDLRNPIAVILGYTEYLQIHLAAPEGNKEWMGKTISNIEKAARRLERYTNSIRDINQLEELELNSTDCILPDMLMDMAEDFRILIEQKGLFFEMAALEKFSRKTISMDSQVTYRILENIVTNAIRYAKTRIGMDCCVEGENLQVVIWDDGDGFPEMILKRQKGAMILGSGEHMGLGLTICQILCRKHGGKMELRNRQSQGAEVIVTLCISDSGCGGKDTTV